MSPATARLHDGDATTRAQLDALDSVVEDLAGKFSLRPLLERILRRSLELLGCRSGSICTVDEIAGTYRKEADVGVACQSGRSFPLSEGVTGAVVAARGPVVFDNYNEVPGSHVRPEDRDRLQAVIGVPIEWGDTIIGACVVFSETPNRRFTPEDAVLLGLFARHAAIAITNAKLHAEAAERVVAEAVSSERERLVREVHDTVARGLASVMLHLDDTSQCLATPASEQIPPEERSAMLAEHVALAREAARTALTETRRTVLGLGPSLLEGRSLEEAVALEVAWAKSTAGLDAKLIVAGEQAPLEPDVAHQVFQIAREALTNIVAHAAASSARIGLVYGSDAVVLLVEDDGRGFDIDQVRGTSGGGLGLRGIVARARRFGGVAQFESTPGWGTRIRVQLPYASIDAALERVQRLSVLVVDSQPAMRAGIVALLGLAEPSVQVVGEIGRVRDVLDAYRMLKPDVVLIALRMPESDGVELTERLRAEDPEAAVVALAGSRDDELVARALRAGVRGCLATDVDGPELARAVLAAAQGDAMFSERILARFSDSHDALDMRLTERETEVRVLLERGLPDKQIAGELGIAPKTVEKHVAAILRKAGVRNRTALVAQSRAAH